MDATVYVPVLEGLEEVGLGMQESLMVGKGMEDILESGLISCSEHRG
jgi:hypothetical protein